MSAVAALSGTADVASLALNGAWHALEAGALTAVRSLSGKKGR